MTIKAIIAQIEDFLRAPQSENDLRDELREVLKHLRELDKE